MTRIKMHISKVKLPFYPPCEVKCRLQNGVSTNIRKNPLPDYHRAPPPYQNWVQIDEIEWDCSKLIETTDVNINVIRVQVIWDE